MNEHEKRLFDEYALTVWEIGKILWEIWPVEKTAEQRVTAISELLCSKYNGLRNMRDFIDAMDETAKERELLENPPLEHLQVKYFTTRKDSYLTLPDAYMLAVQAKFGAKYHVMERDTKTSLCRKQPFKGRLIEAKEDVAVDLEAKIICATCWSASHRWWHYLDNDEAHIWFGKK